MVNKGKVVDHQIWLIRVDGKMWLIRVKWLMVSYG